MRINWTCVIKRRDKSDSKVLTLLGTGWIAVSWLGQAIQENKVEVGWGVDQNGRFWLRHTGFDLLVRNYVGTSSGLIEVWRPEERSDLKIQVYSGIVRIWFISATTGMSPLTQVHVQTGESTRLTVQEPPWFPFL